MNKDISTTTTPCFLKKQKKYRKDTFSYIILSILSVIIFCNSLGNAFVYDDSATIVNNTLIKSWENFYTIFSFNYFILSGELSYRPIVTLSYFIDYSLWGLNPLGFHLTNVLLQVWNTLLFYTLLKRIAALGDCQNLMNDLALNRSSFASNTKWDSDAGFPENYKQVFKVNIFAFVSALLFATHPILTEAVNSISYREDLFAAFFFLISFILFLKIDDKSLYGVKYLLYYAGSLCSYALALFSKEMAVTLPVLMVLFTIFYSSPGNAFREVIKRVKGIYIGYFIITIFYLMIQFVLFRHTHVKLDQTRQSLCVMLKVLALYIKLLFLPLNLNADYVVPPITAGVTSLIVSICIVITVAILIARLCKSNKQYGFFILWFFITLLPVSNIIPIGNIMAERYLYIPIMGFLGAVGTLIQNCNARRSITILSFGIVIIIFGCMGIYRNGIWHDEFTLWHSTSQREPNSARAHHNLGVVHSTKGFYEYAELEYKKTLQINPRDTEAHYNLGNAYERKGMTDDAIKEYQEAIHGNPFYANAYNNLGSIFKKKLLFDKAVEFYKKAIQCNPFNPNYYNNLGLCFYENKLYEEAIIEFKKALKIDPQMSSVHNNLGNTYKGIGDFEKSFIEYKAAIGSASHNADNADAHNNLGILYTNKDQLEEALEEFKTAILLNPKLANVHNNLGIVHAKKGDLDNAIYEMNCAVALGFDNADVHNNLAGVYLTKGLTDDAIIELKLALKFNPQDSNAHCNLGNAYLSRDLKDEAISEFKEAITYNHTDAEIYYYLGNTFYQSKQYTEAVNALYQSIHYQPNNPLAHKMLGVLYANFLNNPSKALFHLKETLRLDPQQPMAEEIDEAIHQLEEK